MTGRRRNDAESPDSDQYGESRSPSSFFEGLVAPTSELQVSPPCVRPLWLITSPPASDLTTTPSAGRVGGEFGVVAAGSPPPKYTVFGPPTPARNPQPVRPLPEYRVGPHPGP